MRYEVENSDGNVVFIGNTQEEADNYIKIMKGENIDE